MAYAYVQRAEDSSILTTQGSVASGAFSSALTAGNLLVCYVWLAGPGSETTVTLSGGGSPTWVAETPINSSQEWLHAFYALNIPGGVTTAVTATFGVSVNYPAIWVAEYSGFKTSGARLAFTGQNFASPSAGADAVTSGLLGTLSAQPAGIIGFAFNENADGTPSTGTSPIAFTNRATGWGYGGTPAARMIDTRVTETTSRAATFGRGSTAQHKVCAFAFEEAASSSSLAKLMAHYQ